MLLAVEVDSNVWILIFLARVEVSYQNRSLSPVLTISNLDFGMQLPD